DKFQGNFNRAIFDIMVYYFSQSKVLNIAKKNKKKVSNAFKELCENDPEFISSFEHTTKSLTNTAKRFETWGEKISEILNLKIRVPYIQDNRLELKDSQNG